MINFFSETKFELQDQEFYNDWLYASVDQHNYEINDINYIFCDDKYLLEINKKHLNHDYYTDIITFDYTIGNKLQGDIFISIDRVADNAYNYDTTFDNELARVMIHGLLHMMGYKDKTNQEQEKMRLAENDCLSFLNVSNEEE
ncbi:rRNA maturation RNase YbeY [Flavobacteriaceae bacterium Ap0902]|nr:rRNA maturation RNase YbeY [Flavobacteriaceae bacterium Ap0902]